MCNVCIEHTRYTNKHILKTKKPSLTSSITKTKGIIPSEAGKKTQDAHPGKYPLNTCLYSNPQQ